MDRTQGVGVISKDEAIDYGLTGPNLRGSGVEHDLRKAHPYLVYDQLKFECRSAPPAIATTATWCAWRKCARACASLHQCLDQLPGGPVNVPDGKIALPPKDRVLTRMEELIHHFINVTQGVNAPPGEIYFGARKPEGRIGLLHQQQGRRHAPPAEDPRRRHS